MPTESRLHPFCHLTTGARRLLLALLLALGSLPTVRAQEETFTLELRQEASGLMVLRQDFITLLESLFDDARVSWDPVNGIMRVEQGRHKVDALMRRALLVVNGQPRQVERPLLLRQGNVLIPVETAEQILQILGVDFELTSPAPSPAGSPAPTAARPPAVTMDELPLESLPQAQPSPTPAAAAPAPAGGTPPPVVLPRVSDQPSPASDESVAPLQPPAGLEGQIGLSWGQLADSLHRTPPRRVVIMADAQLDPLARRTADLIREMAGMEAVIKPTPDRTRDQPDLINQIEIDNPDLFIDLLIAPTLKDRDKVQPFYVWVVNDSLWPQDRQARADTSSPLLRYRPHQYQSLALGSLLRTELGQEFPEGEVEYELVPSYVLRRVNAPSSAVLVPITALSAEAGNEPIARALASALAGYARGMRNVSF